MLKLKSSISLALGLLEPSSGDLRVAGTGHQQWTGAAASLTKKLIFHVLFLVSFYGFFFLNLHLFVLRFFFIFINFRGAVLTARPYYYNYYMSSLSLPVSVQ